jgi:hypothetical protein
MWWIIKMKPKKLSKIAAGTLFALSLIGGKLPAQEVIQNTSVITQETEIQTPAIESELTDIPPTMDFSFNYELEEKPKEITYSLKDAFDDPDISPIYNSILYSTRLNLIQSYSAFTQNASSLTENQKLVLLSVLSDYLYYFSYDENYEGKVYSTEDFFKILQNSLKANTDSIGVCRHIASNIETLANDIGLRAAAVSGSFQDYGHAYDIIKTENGTSIVDSYNIFSSNSKNIEKVLESYQKEIGSIMFQHLFFEDAKFKYELITKDGKNFLVFINYDPLLKEAKDSLINKVKDVPTLVIEGKKDKNIFSLKGNLYGFYVKCGEMSGNLTPEKKIDIGQIGYGHKFLLFNKFRISPEASFIYGSFALGKALFGYDGKIILSTENEKGLNASAKFSTATINMFKTTSYHDMALDAGLSYTLPIGDGKLEPYVLSKFAFLPSDMGTYWNDEKLFYNALETGLKFSFPKDGKNIVIEPHYTNRPWENEIGANIRLGTKNIGIDLEGSVTKSEYDFCPDKSKLSAGLDCSLGPLSLKLSYKTEGTNYDGEKEAIQSFSASAKYSIR